MKILAVDPGSTLIGWSVLYPDGADVSLRDCGLLEPHQGEKSSFNQQANQVLYQTLGQFQHIIKDHEITHVAWEIVPSFGQYAQRDKTVHTVVGLKSLVFLNGLSWFEQAPVAVKKAATGNAKASKAEMRARALEVFPGMNPSLKTWDVYDSALIGYTAWAKGQWVRDEEVLTLVKAV